jgi:hypothetical protein
MFRHQEQFLAARGKVLKQQDIHEQSVSQSPVQHDLFRDGHRATITLMQDEVG